MDRRERTDRNVCHGQNDESGLKLSLKTFDAFVCVFVCCSRPELQLRMRVVGTATSQ